MQKKDNKTEYIELTKKIAHLETNLMKKKVRFNDLAIELRRFSEELTVIQQDIFNTEKNLNLKKTTSEINKKRALLDRKQKDLNKIKDEIATIKREIRDIEISLVKIRKNTKEQTSSNGIKEIKLRNDIRNLIAHNELIKAFEKLNKWSNDDKIILLSGRFNRIINKEQEGLISSADANIERNKIVSDALNFLNTRSNLNEIIENAQITKVTKLDLFSLEITDISPLSSLTILESLILKENKVSDLSPLMDLINLKELDLQNNEITDISPLKDLSKLTKLYLFGNSVSDLEPLSQLSKLTNLGLRANKIGDISPLKNLTNLKYLNLVDCKVQDISPLLHLIKNGVPVKWNYNSIDNGIYLSGNPIDKILRRLIYSDNQLGIIDYL